MATNIFEMFGKIGADDSQANQAIDGVVKKAKNAGKVIEDIGASMQKAGGALTKAITIPIAGAITASVWAFADLEQAIGGIETMFGKAASTVVTNSETAYYRAGVSGTEYMEQVTSFSARLLQGLGGDTVEAAKLADTAMVDMSDNANKFGTDIAEIQNAYQGFAKGNFMMLDNLRLGYGGTAGEMARLINESGVLGETFEATAENVQDIPFHVMIEAIHEIQNEMGVTGTTALEAEETVSGAFGMMKASLQDLAAGFGQENANMEQLMSNFFGSVQVFAENIKRVLGNMWDNLPLEDWQKWVGLVIVAAGPLLIMFGSLLSTVGKVTTAISGAGSVMGGLATLFPNVSAGLGLLKTAFSALMGPIGIVIALVAAMVTGFLYLWNTNESFRVAVIEIWNNIKETIINAWQAVVEYLQPAIQAVVDFIKGIFGGLATWWSENQNMITQAAINAWNFIKDTVSSAMNFILDIMKAVWPAIETVVRFAWNGIKNIIEGATKAITGIIEFFSALFTGNWEALWESVKQIVTGAVQAIWGLIQIWIVGKVVAGIKAFAGAAKSVFSTFWNWAKGIFSNSLSWIWGKVSSVFGSISSVITSVINTIKSVISGGLGNIKASFSNILNSLKGIVTTAFNGVRTAISGGMSKALSTITNFFGRFRNAGSNLIGNIASGISNAAGKVTGAVKGVLQKARDLLPFSPPKDKSSPLADIHKNGIAEQIAKGIEDGQGLVDVAMDHLLTFPEIENLETSGRTKVAAFPDVQSVLGEMSKVYAVLLSILEALREGQGIYIDGNQLVAYTKAEMNKQLGYDLDIRKRGR